MAQRITIEELKLIENSYNQGYKRSDIKLVVDRERQRLGTYVGKGVSTNTISQLKPRGKHYERRASAIHEYWEKDAIIHKIMNCMSCNAKEANSIYNTRVKPLCKGRFMQAGNNNMLSIRYYALACNSTIYLIFSTPDYAETMGLDPSLHEDDVWTVKTNLEYMDIIDGSVGYNDIMTELYMYADGEYEPQLLNVCVLKA